MIFKNMIGGEFSEFTFRFSAVGIVSGILVGVTAVIAGSARSGAARGKCLAGGSGDRQRRDGKNRVSCGRYLSA